MTGARRRGAWNGSGAGGAARAECGGARRGAAEARAASGGVAGHWATRGRAAGVAGAGEEGPSGGLVRAAQWSKRSGEKLRRERGRRGSRRRGSLPVSRAGTSHPTRWFSANSAEVVAARGGLAAARGDPGALLEAWGTSQCFQK